MPAFAGRGREDGTVLLERADELAAVSRLAAESSYGAGRLVLVEGAAGLGKTSLLNQLVRQLRADGMRVLTARAAEQERTHAFGVVRQLFDRLATGAPVPRRAAALFSSEIASGDLRPGQLLHALYWTVADLCQQGPVALVVDDVHEADDASLEFLAYLARRLADLPLLSLLGARPAVPDGWARRDLATLRAEATVVSLAPLSVTAAAELATATLDEPCAPEFAAACHAATGGSPFYLVELLTEAKRQHTRPVAASAADVAVLGPPAILDSVLRHVGTLPAGALPIARAAAVLGDDARLSDCATLAAIPMDRAAPAADALVAAGVLAPGRTVTFAHAILRSAVLADLGLHERALWHARAAEQLRDAGADPHVVATHLLLTEPGGQAWRVQALRTAAADAMRSGGPRVAVRFLERALAEQPEPELIGVVRFELGRAYGAQGDPMALEHVRAGMRAVTDPDVRAARALVFAGYAQLAGPSVDVVDALDDALAHLPDDTSDLAIGLHVERYWNAHISLQTVDRAGDGRHLRTALEHPDGEIRRRAAGYLTMDAALMESREQALTFAHAALAEPGMLAYCAPDSSAVSITLLALACLEAHDQFETLADAASAAAARDANPLAFVLVSTFRAFDAWSRGRPEHAIAEAESAASASAMAGWRHGEPALAAVRIHALLDEGRTAEAADELAAVTHPFDEPDDFPGGLLLDVRGRLRGTHGDLRGAIDDLERCGERMERLRVHSPSMVPWRTHLAEVLLRDGAAESARCYAKDELCLARRLCGPIRQGAALRVLARCTGGDEAITLLADAVDLLAGTPGALEHARALADLGARRRRRRDLPQARQDLASALHAATVAGATSLAEFVHDELVAAGGRPRRPHQFGPDALTPAELRVARLAANGATNTAIAQSLFRSRKTVEKHLASAYRKLQIEARVDLEHALADAE